MSSLTRVLGLLAGTGLAAVLAACGGGGDVAGNDAAGNTAPTASSARMSGTADSSSSAGSARRSDEGAQALVHAGDTVLQKVGSGTVISIDAEKNDTVWEVEVATSDGGEKEAYVSQDGKKIVSGPREKNVDADDRAENKQEVAGAEFDYKEAAQKVLEARSGTITELNLDDYHGGIVWEADVHKDGVKYEVKIDAASGKVVKNKRD